ncbi:hypothetical protein B7494_g2264 [Chlorociboria aeruginascens]|nr:hypothetical protein B7494_g2264 [Chlorociboria aeruginascens]
MDVQLFGRPALELLSKRLRRIISLNTATRRHESSFRRTKKALNIPPAASFLLSKNSPIQDHIIFNPPPSAPSVLHTPLKFLPKEDKRRQLLVDSASKFTRTPLPPPIQRPKPDLQRHHLSEADVEEIRRLRTENPEKWSRNKLAKKFNCSSLFIVSICEAPESKQELEKAKVEAVRARWGPRRTMAREDRVKRLALSRRDG